MNGNTIEDYMQKISKIAWKMKTWTPSRISLVIRGGKGESRGIGKGELLLEQIIVENMFPRLCIHTLDTSHVYVVKNYGKGSEENQKGGKKRGGIFFI